jgi:hypothetical protein
MAGTWSRVKTWASGDTLTHTDLNEEFDNILDESDPEGIGGASATEAKMQEKTDPYASSTTAPLASDLLGEIKRIRYQLDLIIGGTHWYETPNFAINDISSTELELELVDNMWASVTTAFVDGTDGTGTVQFVFKDAADVTMATAIAGEFYVSEIATGATVDVFDTGVVALTNGVVTVSDTAAQSHYKFVTTAAGLFGLTITTTADSYWIVFKHPTGKLVISDELAVTST